MALLEHKETDDKGASNTSKDVTHAPVESSNASKDVTNGPVELSAEAQSFIEGFLMGLLDHLPTNRHLQLLLLEAVTATNNAILHKELASAFHLPGPELEAFASPRQRVGIYLEINDTWSDESDLSDGSHDQDSVASGSIGSD